MYMENQPCNALHSSLSQIVCNGIMVWEMSSSSTTVCCKLMFSSPLKAEGVIFTLLPERDVLKLSALVIINIFVIQFSPPSNFKCIHHISLSLFFLFFKTHQSWKA